jgi:predicted dehydrogenase
MRTSRTPLAVVGLGHLGQLHARNLAAHVPGAELVHVADAREQVARALGEELGVDWSTDYADLLADARVVGVVIATPTSLHVEMIDQAAAVGRHVFTEKPLSLDIPSGRRAIAAARQAGIHLQVGFQRRFDPDYVAAARRVHAGELGKVHFLRSTQRDVRAPVDTRYLASDGDFFVDALIHDFDCARWLAGDIVEVTSCGVSVGSPIFGDAGDVDNVVVALRFASGAVGVVDGSREAGYGYEAGAEIMGSAATLRIAANRVSNVEQLAGGGSHRDYVQDFRVRFAAAYVNELAGFAHLVREGGEPASGGADALAAFAVAQAAARSHAERRPVSVEPMCPTQL